MPGWQSGSYGYHGDGYKFCYQMEVRKQLNEKFDIKLLSKGRGIAYGPEFTTNDVVGCGWNIRQGIVFFTLNGQYLGTAFKNVHGKFYPVVGVNSPGEFLDFFQNCIYLGI
jgi:hypothetical protein